MPLLAALSFWPSRRGYHYNKMSYIYQLHGLGFKFYVHPSAFVIHYAHPVNQKRELAGTFTRKVAPRAAHAAHAASCSAQGALLFTSAVQNVGRLLVIWASRCSS